MSFKKFHVVQAGNQKFYFEHYHQACEFYHCVSLHAKVMTNGGDETHINELIEPFIQLEDEYLEE